MGAVVLHAVQAQDLHDGVAEAAEGLRRAALHEHHHRVRPHQPLHRLPRPRAAAAAAVAAALGLGPAAPAGRLAQRPPGPAPRGGGGGAQPPGRTHHPAHAAPTAHCRLPPRSAGPEPATAAYWRRAGEVAGERLLRVGAASRQSAPTASSAKAQASLVPPGNPEATGSFPICGGNRAAAVVLGGAPVNLTPLG